MDSRPDRLDHNQELYQLSYAHHAAGQARTGGPGALRQGRRYPPSRPVTCVAWAR